MLAEEILPVKKVQIALQNPPASVAFARDPSLPPFFDIRGDIHATWGAESVEINGKQYAYRVWHSLEDKESVLFNYFRSVIISDRVSSPRFGFHFE